MRSAIAALLLCLAPAAHAQTFLNGTIQTTPTTVPICTPVTGTLAALNDAVTLTCPGAPNYIITLSTPAGQSPLVGTIQSLDPGTGAGRRLIKSGVGPLQLASEPLNGLQGSPEYKTVNGGSAQQVKLTAYTSGQATVTITPQATANTVNIGSEVQSPEDVALRQGRSYTATTGIQSVTAGNFLSLQVTNPSTNNSRAFITTRAFGCNVTGTPPEFAGVSNPTANLATTAATITNRRTGGAASGIQIAYGMGTTHPDTSPAATLPPGGFVANGGSATLLGSEYTRTVEPGTSFVNWIGGSGGGLAAAARCHITFLWYEVPIN